MPQTAYEVSVDGIDDSKMVFDQMKPRIRRKLPDIALRLRKTSERSNQNHSYFVISTLSLNCLNIYKIFRSNNQVFNELESPPEVARLQELQTSVLKERHHLIHMIVNSSIISNLESERMRNFSSFVSHKLGDYEEIVQEAVRGGVSLPLDPHNPPPLPARWNLLQAVFFASTVLTTIGLISTSDVKDSNSEYNFAVGGFISYHRFNIKEEITWTKFYCTEIVRGYDQYGAGFVYVDDNARPHRSELERDFVRDVDISNMNWSPDMDCIVHECGMLKTTIFNPLQPIETLRDLIRLAQIEQDFLPEDDFNTLITNMVQRVKDLHNTK
ncbi:hypothetical protein ANN_01535 [Periplaneta americana]|uniref:Uncharacterized protein n=1 Tax=Periplaneta americana TaxID=6978 RepID=A0ABQ8TUY3_PERAM|nr:hypothetical protein ANN_01535 [Periplaneta americana]